MKIGHDAGGRSRFRILLSVCNQAVRAWLSDYAPSMGAAISYYTMFSIAPLLLIVIAVVGLVFNQAAAQQQIVMQIRDLIGAAGAQAVQQLLQSASDPRRGGVAAAIGIAVFFLGATSVFAELQSALDRIWRTPAAVRADGVWSLIRTRLLSFGLILGIGFLLAVSLLLSAALNALAAWWGPMFGTWQLTLRTINAIFGFAVTNVLFAMIYKFLPRAGVGWKDVWIGALVTSLLLELGKKLIGVYLATSAMMTTFGAAASLAVLMVWVYYSAQMFLLGAEFTWVYAHELGSRRGQPRSGQAE